MIAAFADRMAQWPDILIIASFTGTMLALLLATRFAGRRLLPRAGHEERSAAALDTFKVLAPLAGLFLSFSLVQSIGQFRVADVNVSREASNIFQLDRALAISGAPDATKEARLALRSYVRHVTTDEWEALRLALYDSPATVEALARLQREVEAIENALPPELRASNEADKRLDDVQDDRAWRLGIAHGGLPPVMWWVLALLMVLIFTTAACLQGAAARHPLPILYVAGLGLLASLLFIFDRPYQGELSVSRAPLVKVLGQLEARLK